MVLKRRAHRVITSRRPPEFGQALCRIPRRARLQPTLRSRSKVVAVEGYVKDMTAKQTRATCFSLVDFGAVPDDHSQSTLRRHRRQNHNRPFRAKPHVPRPVAAVLCNSGSRPETSFRSACLQWRRAQQRAGTAKHVVDGAVLTVSALPTVISGGGAGAKDVGGFTSHPPPGRSSASQPRRRAVAPGRYRRSRSRKSAAAAKSVRCSRHRRVGIGGGCTAQSRIGCRMERRDVAGSSDMERRSFRIDVLRRRILPETLSTESDQLFRFPK